MGVRVVRVRVVRRLVVESRVVLGCFLAFDVRVDASQGMEWGGHGLTRASQVLREAVEQEQEYL